MIRALVFDFDGVIADTEAPEWEAWRDTWADLGHELTLEEWCKGIGTRGGWDPLTELAARVGATFDAEEATARRRARHEPRIAVLEPLPGVVALLDTARAAGLATAVASSSDGAWVPVLLDQLGLTGHFDNITFYDGTCDAKPAPDLYLRACAALAVAPDEAVAFEDSPNGIAAAKAAGLWCVAVPHAITRTLDVSAADRVVDSLTGFDLDRDLAGFG